jgi:small conductance mechanosensitive channel
MDLPLDLAGLAPYLKSAIRVLVILTAAFVISRLLRAIIGRVQLRISSLMEAHDSAEKEVIQKRTATMTAILRTLAAVGVWSIAIVMSLREAGFDIGPLLAGAGIAGIAIGFGAQSLVKDVVTGAFMLLEDSVRVGDVVQINGQGGLVEEINLRTTVLRGLDGTVHIFPNGSVQTLANMTKQFSYYLFDMGVAYKEDTDRVAQVMKEVAEQLLEDPEFQPLILEPLEILGVDKFADSAVIIKARIKTLPSRQWKVGRELNRRFKKRFDELGIEIPFPHRSLHFGEASGPFRFGLDETTREEIRKLIAEAVDQRADTRAPRDIPRDPS